MNIKKLLISLIFILAWLILFAQESQDMTTGNIRYRIAEHQAVIISAVSKNITAVTIPSYIDGMPVTAIEDDAFSGCTSLTKIDIPNGVIRIGNRAFFNCRLLKNLTIPNSVISIGTGAMHNCYSLTNLTLPNFLVNIGANTFRSCRSLQQLTIPVGVTTIGDYAFSGCKSLRTVVLPDTVMQISPLAFADSTIRLETSDLTIGGTEYSYTGMTQVMTEHKTINGKALHGAFIAGRNVTLAPYQIGKFLVTQELFEQIMKHNPSECVDNNERFLNSDDQISQYKPVENVNFYQAITFCNKLSLRCGMMPCYAVEGIDDWDALQWDDIPTDRSEAWDMAECDYSQNGYRLPTEAELEFAARGGDPNDSKNWDYFTEYYDGTMPDSTGDLGSHQVDNSTPNSLGLYDVSGNVAQLCNDSWSKILCGTAVNPIGFNPQTEQQTDRLCFGCPWGVPNGEKTLVRCPAPIQKTSSQIGFRLARSVSQPTLCAVTFFRMNAETNTAEETHSEYVKYGKTISMPEKLADENNTDEDFDEDTSDENQKTGQVFVGWFAEEDAITLYDFHSPITQDTQIYGKFISRTAAITAPRMMTIIRKHQTADLSADLIGLDSSSDTTVTLQAYQLSQNEVSRSLFASVMGYAPPSPDNDGSAPVNDISFWQAVTFCNKLSLRAGRTPCYAVDGIDDWIGLSFCDIPTKADPAWDALTTDLSADGYRLPTKAELVYAQMLSATNETCQTNKNIRLARTIK
ncbi:MAG: leucine-rich repeat protein [Spirochaetales bacterium]|nr:leucine-rich repeat protein [Spirochaetales bacterium]